MLSEEKIREIYGTIIGIRAGSDDVEFARAIEAEVREQAAQVCEAWQGTILSESWNHATQACADYIRAGKDAPHEAGN